MSASTALIDTLKRELKSLGVTYAAVARALGMSEASVKRMFSRKDFTLKRLDQVLEFAGLELAELTRSLERRDRLVSRLTPQAEKAIVSDKRLVLVALRVLHQWPMEKIVRTYSMSEANAYATWCAWTGSASSACCQGIDTGFSCRAHSPGSPTVLSRNSSKARRRTSTSARASTGPTS